MPTPAELSGHTLHGDDFRPDQIEAWFADEAEAYADMYGSRPGYEYGYDNLNTYHGYRLLGQRAFQSTLALGAAYGHELLPIENRLRKVTIVESSDMYHAKPALNASSTWVAALPSGDLDIDSKTVDLITCFGVLHHIPNVSHVMAECHRVLRPGGLMLVREPITSMGDWEKSRPGLTSRERGVPKAYFEEAVRTIGFNVTSARYCLFAPLSALCTKMPMDLQKSKFGIRLDYALCRLFAANYRYHATKRWHKFRPTSVFWILEKQ